MASRNQAKMGPPVFGKCEKVVGFYTVLEPREEPVLASEREAQASLRPPKRPERVLRVLGRLGCVLERLGCVWGASWGALDASCCKASSNAAAAAVLAFFEADASCQKRSRKALSSFWRFVLVWSSLAFRFFLSCCCAIC